MNFDASALQRLLSESDEKLWQTICKIATLNGISLAAATPPKEEMAKLRTLLSGAGGISYEDALKTLENYKRKG